MSSGKYYPTAVGNPVDGSDGSAVPTAVGHIVDMPTNSVPTFEVRLPFNAGPGVQFGFQVDGRMHSMIVPEGAQPNQTLRCMLVPMGAPPGTDVIVTTPDGDMAVTIPEGMRTGEVLVVDMGDSLRQWVTPEEGCCAKLFRCWSPVCEAIIKVIRCALPFCVCLLLLTMLAAMAGLFRPRHPYGYGGGYGGYGYSQPISSYNQCATRRESISSTLRPTHPRLLLPPPPWPWPPLLPLLPLLPLPERRALRPFKT